MGTENQSHSQVQNVNNGAPVALSAGMAIGFDIAKRNERSLSRFNQKAMSMVTIDKDIAASCFYKLSRKKKNADGTFERTVIEGPSIRLAEIVVSCWGNLWVSTAIVGEDNGAIVAEAKVCDLESNNWITMESRRRITTKNGQRFSDDMIVMTANAASALALRNAIFKAVPFTYIKKIYEEAKRMAVGDVKSLVERRAAMMDAFAKMGIARERVLAYLEVPGSDDIGLGELEDMLGVFNSLKDGDTTIDEIFPEPKLKPAETAPVAPAAPAPAPVSESVPNGTITPPAPPEPEKSAISELHAKEQDRKSRQVGYNTLYSKAKTKVGKQDLENEMERAGIPASTFPSKLTDEQLAIGTDLFQRIVDGGEIPA